MNAIPRALRQLPSPKEQSPSRIYAGFSSFRNGGGVCLSRTFGRLKGRCRSLPRASTLQRFVRAYFTLLIDEGAHLFQDRAGQVFQNGCAVTKSVKATVVKIYPKMKGWDSSTNPAERSAFSEVQRNLRRWRQEGAIWSSIQNRFSSLTLLTLVPHHVRVLPAPQSISGSS